MRSLTLSQNVAVTFAVGLFYGLYLITFCFANRWLFFADEGWRLRKRIHWFMAIMTNLITVFISLDTALMVRGATAQSTFVDQGHRPEDYSAVPWDAIVRATTNTVAPLADIVLMYRLWIVYGKRLWIIWFPAFLWVGGIVCTILQTFLQVVHVHNQGFGPYHWASVNMAVGPGIVLLPFWASTVALNAYSTGLLIRRIKQASGRSYMTGESLNVVSTQFQFLIRILLESGVLYPAISIAHLSVWFGQNDFAVYLVGGINVIIIGSAFNLILIRTARNRAEAEGKIYNGGKLTTIQSSRKPMPVSVEPQSSSIGAGPTVYAS
ncbi:hypothetical protein P691DRAFT_667356 [Macrolepiota fuliginosa MF-IS2]|uniref:Uncharacterized protein n=1 Tax=Macrolepiota fuliginosa MF-IS2 TaxID=1400762 RepID=A0A9P5XGS8_9AGAR|nr:hypothetical protein P691DRAFT_667356 [Macrolepiota fuliginosa MF-IS2]